MNTDQGKDQEVRVRRYWLEPRRQESGIEVWLADPRTGQEWQFAGAEELWIFLSGLMRRGLK